MKKFALVFLIIFLRTLIIFADQGVVPFDELTQKPQLIKQVNPQYPEQARQNNWTGLTIIKIIISKSGKVTQCLIQKSSGYRILDQAAIQAIGQWEFTPGKKNGKTVKTAVTVPIVFRIKTP